MKILKIAFATFILIIGANAIASVKGVKLDCRHSYPSENPLQDDNFRYKYPLSFKIATDNKNDLYTKDSDGNKQAPYLRYEMPIPLWNKLGYKVEIISEKATGNKQGYSIIEISKGAISTSSYIDSDSLTAETRLLDENGQRNIQCHITWIE